MAPNRIPNAAARVLLRGATRALAVSDLARILADEEGITLTPGALVASLRGHDNLVLLENPDPLEMLPMMVHEAGPAYHEALGGAHCCYAVVDARDRPHFEPRTTFDTLAAPLLQVWRMASADVLLRAEVATTLSGLYALLPAIDDAPLSTR